MKRSLVLVPVISLGILLNGHASAYDLQAHRELGTLGSKLSSLGTVLRDELGFTNGAESRFRKDSQARVPEDWIGTGALSEDIPDFRVLNHFHNPLLDWEQAGLTVLGAPFGLSSVLWQQRANQDSTAVRPLPGLQLRTGGGNWSWQDARRAFLEGLTHASPDTRQARFADTLLALGHLTHIVQDASVPAHVRNDAHLRKGFIDFSDGYENFVDTNVARISSFVSHAVRPEGLEVGVPGRPSAPLPIAQLIDSDLFTGVNADVLGTPSLGLSEYTNGNFVSQDTIFSDFVLPREEALQPQELVAEGGGHRQYFRKVGDGEPMDFFVASGALRARLRLRGSLRPNYVLTDRSHESYAAKLLPRAVGYSAALIDYFFRGRLDVDLLAEPDDPTLVRLVGVNASPDALMSGTLTLYTEDVDGTRAGALALDPTTVETVAPGDSLMSARFRVPDTAERFVAVYQGSLGGEASVPSTNFPGGVIGKVLGGVRVEETFSDGAIWKLRTPEGIFPLPITASEIEDLVWGDDGNTLVGRTALGPGAPNLFIAYTVPRTPGTSRVLVEADGRVPVTVLAQVPFPGGLDLGTEVQLTHTIRYREYLPQFLHTIVRERSQLVSETYNVDPNLAESEQTLSRTYRLTLDIDRLDSFRATPHHWSLNQIGLTADHRVVAVVSVTLGGTGERATFVGRQYVLPCTSFPCPTQSFSKAINFQFPVDRFGAAAVALIDITNRRVVASTAPATMPMVYTSVHTVIGNCQNSTSTCTAAEARHWIIPDEGLDFFDRFQNPADLLGNRLIEMSDVALPSAPDFGHLSLTFGDTPSTIVQYRPELARAQFSPVVPRRRQTRAGCLAIWDTPVEKRPCFSVDLDQFDAFLDRVTDASRARTTPERLVLASRQFQGFDLNRDFVRIVVWDPEAGTAAQRHQDESGNFVFVSSVNRQTAVLTTFGDTLTLVPLEGEVPARSFAISADEAQNFVALDPGFLYNRRDLKFYRTRTALERMALPRVLAPGGDPAGNYHAVLLK